MEQLSTDYTAIREGLSSGKELDDKSLAVLLSIGLEYASGLIETEKPVGLEQQTDEVKKYLTEIVLGRINSLYTYAIRFGIEKADSITLFGNLREEVCQRLSLPKESLPESLLNSLLTKGFDPLYNIDPSPVVRAQLVLIRKIASDIVPNNPTKVIESSSSSYIPD